MEDANRGTSFRYSDYREYLVPLSLSIFRPSIKARPAMDADGNLASAAESGQRSPFDSDGKTGIGIVEKRDSGNGREVILAGLDPQRSLSGCRAKILGLQSLSHPIGLFQPVQPGGSKQNRVHLSLG
jgi:hypothetical protein